MSGQHGRRTRVNKQRRLSARDLEDGPVLEEVLVLVTLTGEVYVEEDSSLNVPRPAILIYSTSQYTESAMDLMVQVRGLNARVLRLSAHGFKKLACRNLEWHHIVYVGFSIRNQRMDRESFKRLGLLFPSAFEDRSLYKPTNVESRRLDGEDSDHTYRVLEPSDFMDDPASEQDRRDLLKKPFKKREMPYRSRFEDRVMRVKHSSRPVRQSMDEHAYGFFMNAWNEYQGERPWLRLPGRFWIKANAKDLFGFERVLVQAIENGISVEYRDAAGKPHYFEMQHGREDAVQASSNGMAMALSCALLAIKDLLSPNVREVRFISTKPRSFITRPKGSMGDVRVLKAPRSVVIRETCSRVRSKTDSEQQALQGICSIHVVADHMRRVPMSEEHYHFCMSLAAQGRVFRDHAGRVIPIPEDRSYTIVTAHNRGTIPYEVASEGVEQFIQQFRHMTAMPGSVNAAPGGR